MKVLNIIDEDIVNYHKISMYIAFPYCSMKCNSDAGKCICHNTSLTDSKIIETDAESIINRYINNPLTKAIVIAGLEPFDSKFDIVTFVSTLRNKYNCYDDVVIYTGYTEDELEGKSLYSYKNAISQEVLTQMYQELKKYPNVIVKFGRYREGDQPHFDKTLGVYLSSSNQFAKKIS